MRLSKILLAGLCAAAIAPAAHAATLVNAGFETGSLSGWTWSSGYVDVVTEATDAVGEPLGRSYDPTEGDYFAQLTANDVEDEYAILSQAFTLTSLSRLSFSAAFLAFDYDGYNDDAFVRIVSADGTRVLFEKSVADVGDYGSTPWAAFTSDLLGAGDYVFEAGVRNRGGPGPDYSSKLLLDDVKISAAVPEPATWALMLTGFAGLGLALRRRPRAVLA
ncbi:MAG: PEPxxWA-CTERM sorting domain-containing protein [Pseudomonadota bacterium]